MRKGELKTRIAEILGVNADSFVVERPGDDSKGDFATNVAMVAGLSALEAKAQLHRSIPDARIEVAGPGFINFWLSGNEIANSLDSDGTSDFMKGKRVLVEYSSPNIAKRFSVGHLRSTIVGQALFNLYKNCGAEVTNDNHLGDWGTQFGMIIAAVEEKNLDITKMTVGELEDLYVDFNKRIEVTPELKDKAREAFVRLEKGDARAREIWQKAFEVSMKEFDELYTKLGIDKFMHQYGESVYEESMPMIIKQMQEKKLARLSEGAWIVEFPDLPPAILLKSNGTTTYFTRDLATIRKRLDDPDLRADLYIYEVGVEQTLHFRQVFAAAKMLWGQEMEGKEFVHVAHGRLTLPEGKMSTRKGNTIKLEDLLGRASDKATDEKLALGAVKYNELKRAPGTNYVFRWEEALAMEGNSAPYINYGYVRAKKITANRQIDKNGWVFEDDELQLARWLSRYFVGEVVEDSARNFAPQILGNYLFETAKRFNRFYDNNQVIGHEREVTRLFLVRKVAEVLAQGMASLGIALVESM